MTTRYGETKQPLPRWQRLSHGMYFANRPMDRFQSLPFATSYIDAAATDFGLESWGRQGPTAGATVPS
jgi:hypothetical protein